MTKSNQAKFINLFPKNRLINKNKFPECKYNKKKIVSEIERNEDIVNYSQKETFENVSENDSKIENLQAEQQLQYY